MKNKIIKFFDILEKWTFRILLIYGVIILSLTCLIAILYLIQCIGVI